MECESYAGKYKKGISKAFLFIKTDNEDWIRLVEGATSGCTHTHADSQTAPPSFSARETVTLKTKRVYPRPRLSPPRHPDPGYCTSNHWPCDCIFSTTHGSGLERASRSEIPRQATLSSTLVRHGELMKPSVASADS